MWCTSTAKRPRPNFSPSSLLASSSSTSPRVQELRNIFWRNIIQKIINKKTRAKTVSAQWEKSNKWPSKQKPKWSRAFKQKPRIGFKPTHRFTPADLLLMRSCRGWPERSAPTFSSRCSEWEIRQDKLSSNFWTKVRPNLWFQNRMLCLSSQSWSEEWANIRVTLVTDIERKASLLWALRKPIPCKYRFPYR